MCNVHAYAYFLFMYPVQRTTNSCFLSSVIPGILYGVYMYQVYFLYFPRELKSSSVRSQKTMRYLRYHVLKKGWMYKIKK